MNMYPFEQTLTAAAPTFTLAAADFLTTRYGVAGYVKTSQDVTLEIDDGKGFARPITVKPDAAINLGAFPAGYERIRVTRVAVDALVEVLLITAPGR